MISRGEFEEKYRKFLSSSRNYLRPNIDLETSKALFFYDLIIPHFDPENRKIRFLKTCLTRGSKNSGVVKTIMELNNGSFVDSLAEANTGIYWGDILCDFKEEPKSGDTRDGYSIINDILREVAKRDITGLLFYNGERAEICLRYCLEPKEIYSLHQQGRRIIEFPLGRAYQRRTFTTTE